MTGDRRGSRGAGIAALSLFALLAGCGGAVMPEGTRAAQSTAVTPAEASATVQPAAGYEEAKAHLAAGRLGLAAQAFRQAHSENPYDAGPLNGLGIVYDRMGRHDTAQRYYQRALALDEGSAATLNNLGFSLLLDGRPDAAQELFAAAAEADGDERIGTVIAANLAQAEAATPRGPTAAGVRIELAELDEGLRTAWVERIGERRYELVTRADAELRRRVAELPLSPREALPPVSPRRTESPVPPPALLAEAIIGGSVALIPGAPETVWPTTALAAADEGPAVASAVAALTDADRAAQPAAAVPADADPADADPAAEPAVAAQDIDGPAGAPPRTALAAAGDTTATPADSVTGPVVAARPAVAAPAPAQLAAAPGGPGPRKPVQADPLAALDLLAAGLPGDLPGDLPGGLRRPPAAHVADVLAAAPPSLRPEG